MPAEEPNPVNSNAPRVIADFESYRTVSYGYSSEGLALTFLETD